MADPFEQHRDDSSHRLLAGWSLEEDTESADLEDSLFATPPVSPPPRAEIPEARAPRPPRIPPPPPLARKPPSKPTPEPERERDAGSTPARAPELPMEQFQLPSSPLAGSLLELAADADFDRNESIGLRSRGLNIALDAPAAPRPPKVGDQISDFLLVAELGRGAFARVYLAEQVSLGYRRVALKVSRAEGDEPRMLARLQHAHIVPILSLHDDSATGLRLMCMPYLGGANLAQVLEAAGERPSTRKDRCSIVEALDEVSLRLQKSVLRAGTSSRPGLEPSRAELASAPARDQALGLDSPRKPSLEPSRAPKGLLPLHHSFARVSLPRIQSIWSRISGRATEGARPTLGLDDRDFDQPARQFLRQANGIQAAVWIIARLAEGLEHAHSRGLLHRDLKPSNILIASDGTPMLLDFNLSSTTESENQGEGDGEDAAIGGTLPYMSPEHLDAFHPDGRTSPRAVDERSDIYSLGMILFEMIAGHHPFPEPPKGKSLPDVIRFLWESRGKPPSLRAAKPSVPWSLDAIVARCLAPDPRRRYARARELAEDLNCFLEDLPLEHTREPSIRERAAKWARRNPRICNTTSIATLAAVFIVALGGMAGLFFNNMQTLASRLKLQVFRRDVNECRFFLNLASGPSSHIDRGLELAGKTLEHQGFRPDGTLRGDSWVNRLTPAEQDEVRRSTLELILMNARARVSQAGRSHSEVTADRELEEAVAALDLAEKLDPDPPSALFEDRARYLSALGRANRAGRDRRELESRLPKSARDFCLRGTGRLARGDIKGAEDDLLGAVDLDPLSFWSWFALGCCRLEQQRALDAAGDFAVCTALEPRFAWPHLNRGVALARAGRLEEARHCYERALRANDRFAEAWVDLGLADLELGRAEQAERELAKAVELGRDEPAVLAAWAEATARNGRREEARARFDELLKSRPNDASILTARGIFLLGSDPEAARRDLERVLEIAPGHPRAHYGLAVLVRGGDPTAAMRHVQSALESEPGFLDALQLRALLRARAGELAAIDDAERLCRAPTPHRLYNAACVHALLCESTRDARHASRALGLLERALEAGFPARHAAVDPDLRALHPREEFRTLVSRHSVAPRSD